MSALQESDYSSSSDEGDDDYVPSGDDESGDDLEGLVEEDDVEGLTSKGQSELKKKQKGKKGEEPTRRRRGWAALEELETEDTEEKKDADKARQAELEKAKQEEAERKKEESEKKRADSLWSSFLSDVKQKPKPKPSQSSNGQPPKQQTSSSEKKSESEVAAKPKDVSSQKSEDSKPTGTLKITKVFDFAGEAVKVTKEVAASSKEAKSYLKQQADQDEKAQKEALPSRVLPSASSLPTSSKTAAPSGVKRSGGGLGNIVGQIGKKQKISVLEKSRLDWESFKQDEGIEDELKIHNRGKEGFVERQRFLERTDFRQYEIERELRMSQNKINR